jgi:hypothetical protein
MALNASQVESLANGLAGALGASIGCYCVAPLGLIVTTLTSGAGQASSSKTTDEPAATAADPERLTILGILQDRVRSEGILGLWRGEWINALTNFMTKFCFFFCYSVLTQWYEKRWGLMSKPANLLLGYIAKLLPVPICYPMQVLTNRMQTSATPLGPRGAMREVVQDSGWVGLWSGAESYFVLAIWPALEVFIFDQIKRSILLSRGLPFSSEISGGAAFVLGALGRFLATTLVFPTIRTRSLCQKGVYPSVPSALRGMYRDGGIALIYQGLGPELIRGVSYNAVIMSVKEITMTFCRHALAALFLRQ